MTTATMTASRVDYHTAEWIEGTGERAALMKFNGASDGQIRDRMEFDFPAGEVHHGTYLGMARTAYRKMWARLAPHHGKGLLARLTWDGDLVFAPAERLADIPDAGWNWVKELRGV